MKTPRAIAISIFAFSMLLILTSCGGGSSSGGGGGNPPPPAQMQIITSSTLPGTLQGHSYSVTLQAINGVGALKWSIAPISPTTSFVDGLTIDANTGVLSGTANFAGTCGFTATVSDSKGRSTQKSFTVDAAQPLSVSATKTLNVSAYYDVVPISLDYQGGVYPLTFTFSGGSLPPGFRLDSSSGTIRGAAYVPGTYVANVTITDSFSPAESGTQQITFTINRPQLTLNSSLPGSIPMNKPFSGNLVATGGTPPYSFSITSGSLPAGLSLTDPGAGTISGTATMPGSTVIEVTVTDSSMPVQTATMGYAINVAAPLGRNDTVQTATAVSNGMYSASISPYIDPPVNVPLPGDQDYYKVVSVSGSIVHAETFATRWNTNDPVDTVMEIVDSNGVQLATCRQPGDNSNTFTSACLNDDIGGSPYTTDSSLDIQVPGAPSTPTTFYVHILDWRGDARPDMAYTVSFSGIAPPLVITTQSLPAATRSWGYSQGLSWANGTPPPTWSVISGSLPPGLSLDSGGSIIGTATTDGIYPFTLKLADSSSPQQTATADFTIQVGEPVQFTSSPTWPDACVNQPYNFALQTTGGIQPFTWTFFSMNWVAGISLNQSTGVFSGTPGITGTFNGSVGVMDATGNTFGQTITLTVKNCP